MTPETSTAGLGSAASQTLLTRFIIFEPVGGNMMRWDIKGTANGRDRGNAARNFYGPDEPPLHVAVSENAWRVKQPRDVPFELPDGPVAVEQAATALQAATDAGPDDAT